MNVENLRALRDFILSEAHPFDMGVDDPRTACCIAGQAAIIWPETRLPAAHTPNWQAVACKLDISYDDAWELFLAWYVPRPLSEITREEAIATLDHLIKTGEVQWAR